MRDSVKINVKLYARRFEILCMVFIPIVFIVPGLVWFFGDKLMDSTYGLDLKTFSLIQRLGMFLLDSISSAFVIYGLSICVKIARLFQQGEVFSAATAVYFSRLSKIAAWWGLYNMAEMVFLYGFLMLKAPKQVAVLALGVGGLMYLFIFIFLSILATLVAKASELQNDQDLTV